LSTPLTQLKAGKTAWDIDCKREILLSERWGFASKIIVYIQNAD
jgi:hypothetical protein